MKETAIFALKVLAVIAIARVAKPYLPAVVQNYIP